jgi:hypothetical protein
MSRRSWPVLIIVLLFPAVAAGQSPTAPAHPALPWALGTAIPTGQLIGYIWVAPKTVVIDTVVPMPPEAAAPEPEAPAPEATGPEVKTPEATAPADEAPPAPKPAYGTLRQTLVVPGYYVRQTTAGYYYPDRWMLEQTAAGSYAWRLLPAEVSQRVPE